MPQKNALSSFCPPLPLDFVYLSIPAELEDLISLFHWKREDNRSSPPLVLWLVDWEFYSLLRLSVLAGNTDHLCLTLNFGQLSLFDYKMRIGIIVALVHINSHFTWKSQGLYQGMGNWHTECNTKSANIHHSGQASSHQS